MHMITRGLSPRLLATAPSATSRVFSAWTSSVYGRVERVARLPLGCYQPPAFEEPEVSRRR